ncbi:hypothetical protein RDI58_030180 [Solanum bulbocastanum]|uniref:Uncharacterized protein n=1 Tax=Solanum bulbocastanum TaxID=147425 RepID=A0AAN8STN2_SOLBU
MRLLIGLLSLVDTGELPMVETTIYQ